MHLTFDPEFNVAYIRLRSKRGKVTTIPVSDELNVDIDASARVYGIELLNANQQLGSHPVKRLVVENRRSGKTSRLALTA